MLDIVKEPWPPVDYYQDVFAERQLRLMGMRGDPERIAAAKVFYRTRPLLFIKHWGVCIEPREASGSVNALTLLPFIPFKKQVDLIKFLYAILQERESGLVEKSRDMGATWTCVLFAVWLWLFWPGAVVGFGSRGSDEVDQIGNPNSILEKVRIALRALPEEFYPAGFDPKYHMSFMRIVNPETSAMINGDVGDNIGRGGRSLVYFCDESAHYVHPELVEAALSENAAVKVDISSVHGIGTVFHRRREAGVEWEPGVELPKGRTRVFVLDWRDHPGKTQDWYDQRRQKFEDEGLLHIFAQEVDRDYSASVEGVIIPAQWIKAAIDAHIRVGLKDDGLWGAGLDIADEGGDTNAITIRKGIVCKEVGEWGARDPGETTRKVIAAVHDILPLELQYDCIGIGVSVKSEVNRLRDEGKISKKLRLVPWNAAAAPLWKEKRVVEYDKNSPLNEDFYQNLKAQAWWQVRQKFQNTWRIFNDPDYNTGWKADDLISLDSKSIGPVMHKLVKELSQPTFTQSSKLKLMVDKKPQGAKSPNLADSFVMAYWRAVEKRPLIVTNAMVQRAMLPNMYSLHRAQMRRR
jgi:phage terminase large subunit